MWKLLKIKMYSQNDIKKVTDIILATIRPEEIILKSKKNFILKN